MAKTKPAVKAETKAKATAKPKTKAETQEKSVGETEVTVCRRRSDRREAPKKGGTRSEKTAAPETSTTVAPPESTTPAVTQRRKVPRRRQIDPTTCERDYTNDEIEFMHALDAYKRSSGRMFPTCSEVLEVVRGLGYAKLTPEEYAEYQAKHQPETADLTSDDSDADEDGEDLEL